MPTTARWLGYKEHMETSTTVRNGKKKTRSSQTIRLRVISAKNLFPKDSDGTSDPYLVIKFENQRFESAIVQHTLIPTWNQEFDLVVSKKWTRILLKSKKPLLRIHVWDKDYVGRDSLGKVVIDITPWLELQYHPNNTGEWVVLRDDDGEEVGELCISGGIVDGNQSLLKKTFSSSDENLLGIEFDDNIEGCDSDDMEIIEMDRSMENSLPSYGNLIREDSMLSLEDANEVAGVLYIEVIEAKALPKDRNLIGVEYNSDPFVVVTFGKQSFRTRFKRHSLNPVWKESAYFAVRKHEFNFSLLLSVYDHDTFSLNDHIGRANVPIQRYLSNPGEVKEDILPLELKKQDGINQSTLKIRAWYTEYSELKRNFWKVLGKMYDHDENGKLNRIEFITMLESVGSTLTEETIDEMFRCFGPEEDSEVVIEDMISSFENIGIKSRLNKNDENIVLIHKCPMCQKRFNKKKQDLDIIIHLVICSSQDLASMDNLVMAGFLTEEYASRKWFSKIFGFLGYGGYNIGKNNGNIFVQDRQTGVLKEEKMPMYIRLGLRMTYQNPTSIIPKRSRMAAQLLQKLTVQQGKKFDDPSSAKNIKPFIAFHEIPLHEIKDQLDSFKTFNEFFYRELKPGSRRVASDDKKVAVSCADCRLGCFSTVTEATQLWIKGQNFTISRLLDDEPLAQMFENGSLAIFRLAPQDYHRFHAPVDGEVGEIRNIQGKYYTVNPMAVRRKTLDVYTENVRSITTIQTEHFGKVCFVAIGAMMVGSIVFTCKPGDKVSRLDEMGYFKFGGSTVIVLFQPNIIQFDADLLLNSGQQFETLVKVGDSIGKAVI